MLHDFFDVLLSASQPTVNTSNDQSPLVLTQAVHFGLRLSMVLRLRQHNIGYTADGFYRCDDPTNSVKALKEGG